MVTIKIPMAMKKLLILCDSQELIVLISNIIFCLFNYSIIVSADFVYELRWYEGHPICKISLVHVVFRT